MRLMLPMVLGHSESDNSVCLCIFSSFFLKFKKKSPTCRGHLTVGFHD